MDDFQKLTANERRQFNDLMAMRDADGRLLRTADEAATNLLKGFVTQHGKLNPELSEKLGGQPLYGRNDILLDLLRALTGPHPQPQAWLEAQRHGSLNLFKPASIARAVNARRSPRSDHRASSFSAWSRNIATVLTATVYRGRATPRSTLKPLC